MTDNPYIFVSLFRIIRSFQEYDLIMEKENTNWYAMSDTALIETIGSFIKDCRLQQNKTQQEVADAAGVSRSTLVQLENGSGGNLSSLIQVLRVLEQLHLLQNFEVRDKISPLLLAKAELNKRKRARNANKNKKPETDW